MLATNWSGRANNGGDSLTNSLEKIAESRRLLATLELSPSTPHSDDAAHGEPTLAPAAPIAPHAEIRPEADRDPAALSVHVSQDGMRLSWTVWSPSEEILGRGMADTELKARVDAFCAGMIYLAWTKNRSPSGLASLH